MPTFLAPAPRPVYTVPKVVQEYFDIPSTVGVRNERLVRAACQLRDMGQQEGQVLTDLMPFAHDRDGLPENEVSATVTSIFTRPARAVPRGTIRPGEDPGLGRISRATIKTAKPTERKSAKYVINPDFRLPEGMPDAAKTFVNHLFKAGERIMLIRAVLSEEGKETIGSEQPIFEREKLCEILDRTDGSAARIFSSKEFGAGGVYFCLNPLGKTSNKRVVDNIADLRHALIEFDSIPKEQQYQLIQQSRIPCLALTDSGGKSIHAIVKINARSIPEYKERVEVLMDHFREYGVDPKTKDPTRLSRFPGVKRADTAGDQKLLHLTMGCVTFEEWQAEQLSSSDELPDQMSIPDMISFNPKSDPNNLIGHRFLCKGSAFIISGQSGIGKSSFGLQMLLCWAVSRDFFGIKAVEPLKVMVVQSENDLGDMAEALTGIIGTSGLNFSADEVKMMHENVTIFRDTSHTGDEFISMLHTLISKVHPHVVLIDPLLAVVGDDIGEAKVVGNFFRRGLNAMMQVTGVVVVFMHHVPKPKDERKGQTNKDLSYAGSGSSDLTNWPRAVGVLQKLGNLDAFQFIMAKREKRTGMTDDEGNWTDCIQLQHGKDGIYWERMDTGMREEWETAKAETESHTRGGRPAKVVKHLESRLAAIRKFITESPDASQRQVTVEIERLYDIKGDDKKARLILKDLIDQKIVTKIEPEGKGKPAKFKCGENP